MKISIVTINFNDVKGLKKTFDSVLAQTYKNIEYIVIDGGSSDGSAELIEKYQGKIAYWISEKDRGIYNAMNKGIAKATGDYIVFINSGDELSSDHAIADIVPLLNNHGVVYSDIEVSENGQAFSRRTYPPLVTFRFFVTSSIPHPGCFIRTDLFNQFGNYDETLKISSDWKWFVNVLCKHNVSYTHSGLSTAKFNLDGISSNPANLGVIKEEKEKVLKADFPLFFPDYINSMDMEIKCANMHGSRLIKILRKFGLLSKLY